MIPFLDLKPGADAADVHAAIDRVVARGWFVLGPELEAFETEWAASSQATQAYTAGGHLDANGVYVETKNQSGGLLADSGTLNVTENLRLGESGGMGSMTIRNNARVNAGVTILGVFSGSGTMTVSGSGSSTRTSRTTAWPWPLTPRPTGDGRGRGPS